MTNDVFSEATVQILIAGCLVVGLAWWTISSNSRADEESSEHSAQDPITEESTLLPKVPGEEVSTSDSVGRVLKSKLRPETGESTAIDRALASKLVSRLTLELALNRDELVKIKWACRAVALGLSILIFVVLEKQ